MISARDMTHSEPSKQSKVERNYKTENALSDLLLEIRDMLDQIDYAPMQVASNDNSHIAIIYRNSVRIQLVSKSTDQLLEFVDCEYNWMSSDITKADFCRINSDDSAGERVEIDHSDAFDLIYRSVYKLSVDLPANRCTVNPSR